MIALDTNILVRFLVDDEPRQARTAREFLERLTGEQPGFVCREVIVELVWVLKRTYGFSRNRISSVLDALIATEELHVETSDDVARAALQYSRGGAGFSELMIAAAAQRAGAQALYTFDRKAARIPNATLLTS